ncbi:hypothetical protein EPN87_01155 [archaeon]|nr:MAG: hypothetical protein EPN87_01155 [archaeon]
MPERVVTEKVPGGKLLRIKVDYSGTINSVKITGDFFLHPEEAINDIEKSLVGAKADDVLGIVTRVVQEKGIELIGVTPDSIASVIRSAMQ